MDELKKAISEIQRALFPLFSFLKKCCAEAWRCHMEKVEQRKKNERERKIQAQQDELQRELVQVLQNFSYSKLKQVNSIAELRQDGYKDTDGKVIYYFTIDKTDWQKFPFAVCKAITNSMNKDIFTFGKNLAASYFPNDIFLQYPALFYGVRITTVENQEIMVRLVVVTNMPL